MLYTFTQLPFIIILTNKLLLLAVWSIFHLLLMKTNPSNFWTKFRHSGYCDIRILELELHIQIGISWVSSIYSHSEDFGLQTTRGLSYNLEQINYTLFFFHFFSDFNFFLFHWFLIFYKILFNSFYSLFLFIFFISFYISYFFLYSLFLFIFFIIFLIFFSI